MLVALTGTGAAPVLSVSTASLTFTGLVNVASAAQVVTVTNSGLAPMSISGIVLGGTNANQFARTTTCTTTLAAGASCTVSVTFKATTVGAKAASLSVNVAAPAVSQVVALSGVGQAPVLALAPASLAFGTVARGAASVAQAVTVSNTGNAPLTISSITLTGKSATSFVISASTCGTSVAAGATCSVSVQLKPAAGTKTGTASAALSVAVGAPATSGSVTLSGTVR